MKHLTLLTLILLTATAANAAWLRNVPVELRQPDGTVIHCFATGDEFNRRLHDQNDYTIVQHPSTGFYVYAIAKKDRLAATDFVVGRMDPSILQIPKGADIPAAERELRRTRALLKSAKIVPQNPTKGTFNNIVISIRFSDQSEYSFTVQDYNLRFNAPGTISLKSYYKEVSGGQLDITSHYFPVAQNNQILSYQDSRPRNYYSPYHPVSNPGGYTQENYMDREFALLENALRAVSTQVAASGIDFDSNNDGFADNVTFIFQGGTDNWGQMLWPMAGNMAGGGYTVGNLEVGAYNKQLTGLLNADILSHEFFHSLGAPDLYRYYDRGIDPVGAWDIMSITGVQHMTVFMKWKYGRWIDDLPTITQPGTYTLEPVSKSAFSAWKIPSPASDREYFVVEYRKKDGMFESYLPTGYGDGMIIYRINTDARGNADGPPDEVYVYRPGGTNELEGYLQHAAFSPASGRTQFNDQSDPACFLSNGSNGRITLSGVTIENGNIRFTLHPFNPLPKPLNAAAALSGQNILLTWAVPAADTTLTLQGYNIYAGTATNPLNAQPVATNSYTLPLPGNDLVYTFRITAVYKQGESQPATCQLLNTTNPFLLDSLALVALYQQCDGPNWGRNDNWLTGPLHTWAGVTVSNNRVTWLSLYNDAANREKPFGMRGSIPKEIGYLTALRHFGTQNNELSGPLPPEFWNCTALEYISFFSCGLSGTLPPEVGNLKNLKSIDLTGNKMEGTLPGELYGLPHLHTLTLGSNRFSGTLSEAIGNLTKLQNIVLDMNQFSGPLPRSMAHLPELFQIYLNHNQFDGTLPPEWGSMPKLSIIGLNGNYLTGTIPPEWGNLTQLTTLQLGDNLLEGEVPAAIWALSNLNALNLAGPCPPLKGKLTGTLPPELWEMKDLDGLFLNNNQFTGTISPSVGNLKKIRMLYLQENQLSGDIPNAIGNLQELWSFLLYDNRFTGSLPREITQIKGLYYLDFFNNQFENMPNFSTLGNLRNLLTENNRLTFEDIEPNLKVEIQPGACGFRYAPQAKVGQPETRYAPPGKPLKLSVYVGGSANRYQWYRNGQPVSEIQESPEWTLPNVVPGDNGTYYCRIHSLVVPVLVLESHPVTITGDNRLIAHAGPDRGADEGTLVILDGSASHHPDNLPLLYQWSAPAGIVLTDEHTPYPKFSAPLVANHTTLSFVLTVSMANGTSATDTVAVAVRNTGAFNTQPIADAGSNQTVIAGGTVQLDGSGSFDPDGDPLAFLWTAPEGITLSSATAIFPSFTAPQTEQDLTLEFSLVVSDGRLESTPSSVTILVKQQPVENRTPIAWAGSLQRVYPGSLVNLDGSGSFDPDGDPLTYQWTAPAGITLSSATAVSPSFTAPQTDQDLNLVFTLVVSDGKLESPPSSVTILVKQQPVENRTPIAWAGSLQRVYPGSLVNLDGSGSFDPDGDPLTYQWTAPAGITLSSATDVSPSFTAPQTDQDLNLVFTLVVSDGKVESTPASVTILVTKGPGDNRPPVANAGNNQAVTAGSTVSLNGTGSYDPEGQPLTYRWTAPAGITLSSATDVSPSFTAPETDNYLALVFTLVVSDGKVESTPAYVTIFVTRRPEPNRPPVADAGSNQTLYPGEKGELDGSGSYHPEHQAIFYRWTAPAGIALSDSTDTFPSFTAPQTDTVLILHFRLIVTDVLGLSDTATVQITVIPLVLTCPKDTYYDTLPNSGTSQGRTGQSFTTLKAGVLERIMLTVWPEGYKNAHLLLRKWVSDDPAEALSGEIIARSANAALKPPVDHWEDMSMFMFPDRPELEKNKKYVMEVKETQAYFDWAGTYAGGRAYDMERSDVAGDMRFAVYICPNPNQVPVAVLTDSLTVKQGTLVRLDGSASYDPDGDPVTYRWTAPEGIILTPAGAADPAFTAPAVSAITTFRITLTVHDGDDASEPATLWLTVLPVYRSEEMKRICAGQNYLGWTETGIYIRALLAANGADSIVTTYLTVLPKYQITEQKSICSGSNYLGWTASGTYHRTLRSVEGCDSLVTTQLTVVPVLTTSEQISRCPGTPYHGWTESGTYTRTLRSVSGCDSIVTTYLTVLPKYQITEQKSICNGSNYLGWTTAGTYQRTLQAVSGCDSIVTTYLTVLQPVKPLVMVSGDTLRVLGTYSGYVWYREGIAIQGTGSAQYIIARSGRYRVEVRDDTGCTAVSDEVNLIYSAVPLTQTGDFNWSVMPNPNRGEFLFRVNTPPPGDITLVLINPAGQILGQRQLQAPVVQQTEPFDVRHLAKGIYILQIRSGEMVRREKVIVR